jgi:diguanylate cyclase (GGDEF)-like protein/PAS domain S-box-containing protein
MQLSAADTAKKSLSISQEQQQSCKQEQLIYLRYIIMSSVLFGLAATIQFDVIMDKFKPEYILMPVLLALGFGMLFGRIAILKERLAQQTRQFRAVADFAQEFTYFRSINGDYEYVSPSCKSLTGYTQEQFYAKANFMDKLIHPEDIDLWRHHIHHVNEASDVKNIDLRIIHKDGHVIWINHVCGPVVDESGNVIGMRSTNINISERKDFEEHIERMAYYDALTDLLNRHSLTREISNLIEHYHQQEKNFALLFLDLDRFKHINDSLGHELGDRLLIVLADRMKECCTDNALITRFGGDEFVIVLPLIDKVQLAVDYARKLLELIEQPVHLDDKEFYVSGSIGIVLYPYDGRDAETLIRHADATMFEAKKDLHGNIRLYSPDLMDTAAAFISTENRIRQGLKNHEFIAHYQPKVDLVNGNIVSVEALARWQTHDRGLLMPGEFISIAEETGLIGKLGQEMLVLSCEQLLQWQQQGYPISVAVNLSGVQLAAPEFIKTVKAIISNSRCDPTGLELEITEQVFLNDFDAAIEKLQQLKELGVSIAVDDFGTGYSSLSYLKRLPIDTLKVDRSFTHDICYDKRDVSILRAIVLLCQELKLNTVIEGIETEEQHALVKALGCDVAQGYLFHKPKSVEELNLLLQRELGRSQAQA